MEAGDGGVDVVVDSKDLQQQSKAFNKLTDRVEDRQLDSSRAQSVLFRSLTYASFVPFRFLLLTGFFLLFFFYVAGHGIDCGIS